MRRHHWAKGDTCQHCGVQRSGVALHSRYGGFLGCMYYRRPGEEWTDQRPECEPKADHLLPGERANFEEPPP